MKKQWHVISDASTETPSVREAAKAAGILPLTALLLANRGFTDPEAMKNFITLSDTHLHDPFLMPDMEKAVARMERAIAAREKVLIYGDYDVDGVTSISVLYLYLKSRGLTVSYYIPDRNGEGYGVNNEAIARFAKENVTLIVTVDTGVTAVEEVDYASSLGIDTVVTDHHECQSELPRAVAVVNPRRPDAAYPFKELAGVGVVFKFITAIETKRHAGAPEQEVLAPLCRQYLDLVAMGTVADVMPLLDENRLMVKWGLALMSETPRPGVTALLNAAAKGARRPGPVNTSSVGFIMAPRINAAGRIDSATKAVSLFLSDSEEETAAIAETLCAINRERQELENHIMVEAEAKIGSQCDLAKDKILVLADDAWHHGVIGIVASRITERYGMPSILISFDNDQGKGSGRSVKGLNLVEALTACADLLVKFGGHELAAGLSIKRELLPAFRERINAYVAEHMAGVESAVGPEVDCDLPIRALTLDNAEAVLTLEPFGVANPMPLFQLSGATVRHMTQLGEKNTKFLLEKEGIGVTALRFGRSRQELEFYTGDKVDVIFQLSINEFRGVRSVQLLLRGMRLADPAADIRDKDRRRFREILEGAPFDEEDNLLPTREDLAAVYLFLKRRRESLPGEMLGVRLLLARLADKADIGYIKARLCLLILEESGLVTLTYTGEHGENFTYTVNPVRSKVNPTLTPTYLRVRAGMRQK